MNQSSTPTISTNKPSRTARAVLKKLPLGLAIISALLTCQSSAAQSTACAAYFSDLPYFKSVASASFFANLAQRPGSVRFESEQTFRRAEQESSDLEAPSGICPEQCSVRPIPYMHFRSAPAKLRTDYSDQPHCKMLEKTTAHTPIKYSNNNIKTVEDLIAWIGELTQGKGPQGSDLYEKCDKSCSPRYEYQITKVREHDQTYAVTVSIVCGEARDKSDNMYDLDFFFRWVCEGS